MKTVDYDIHGLVGIRLVQPTESDAAAVDRQLGPMRGPLDREPDILIRFGPRLPLPDLRYLGLFAGFNQDGYYILRSSKAEARVRIPFDRIGSERCEIVCQSGLRSVPLLIAILNLTLLKKGCIPLHASAFVYNDTGVLVTGWSKGGKTEAMLAFTHHGARYVGDEWVILAGDGTRMYGLPEPVTVWDWHMNYLPEVRKKVGRNKARIIKAVKGLTAIHSRIEKSFLKNSFPARTLSEALPALQRQMHVNFPPQRLFGEPLPALHAAIDRVFFIMSHASERITVEPYDSNAVIERMISSIEYEQIPIKEHYLAYRFAFPERRNDFIERAPELQAERLRQALRGKPAYLVRHPYPVSLPALFDKMRPFCEAERDGKLEPDRTHVAV